MNYEERHGVERAKEIKGKILSTRRFNFENLTEGEKESARIKKREAQILSWTEERRKEMSNRVSGVNNPFYGRRHSEETKIKIKKNSEIYNDRRSVRMKENNPMRNPSSKERMIETQKKSGNFDRFGEKISELWKEGKMPINILSDAEKKKASVRMIKNNPMKNKEISEKMGATMKEKWKDVSYRKRRLSESFYRKTPTYLEIFFEDFVESNELPFRYVGDKKFWIGPCVSGKCRNPDFIHSDFKSNRLAIEVCGWQNQKEKEARERDYKEKNISVLFINKKELFSDNLLDIVKRYLNEVD